MPAMLIAANTPCRGEAPSWPLWTLSPHVVHCCVRLDAAHAMHALAAKDEPTLMHGGDWSYTTLPLYFIAYCFYYAYTTLMHGGDWCYLDYGESAARVTWVRGG